MAYTCPIRLEQMQYSLLARTFASEAVGNRLVASSAGDAGKADGRLLGMTLSGRPFSRGKSSVTCPAGRAEWWWCRWVGPGCDWTIFRTPLRRWLCCLWRLRASPPAHSLVALSPLHCSLGSRCGCWALHSRYAAPLGAALDAALSLSAAVTSEQERVAGLHEAQDCRFRPRVTAPRRPATPAF